MPRLTPKKDIEKGPRVLSEAQTKTLKRARIRARKGAEKTIVHKHDRVKVLPLTPQERKMACFERVDVLLRHADRYGVTKTDKGLARRAIQLLEDTFLA